MNQIASHFRQLGEAAAQNQRVPLGQMLLDSGKISVGDLLHALSAHKKLNVPLGRALVADQAISETDLYDALALQWKLPRANLQNSDGSAHCRQIGLSYCLKHRAIPAGMSNGVLLLAVSGMDGFSSAEHDLEETYGLVTPLIATPREIFDAQTRNFGSALAEIAASDVPIEQSCRALSLNIRRRSCFGLAALCVVIILTLYWPATVLILAILFSIGLSLASALLKTVALLSHLLPKPSAAFCKTDLPSHPLVSIMVPLHREPDIAAALVERLSRLTYPKSLLEVLLVVEENDLITRDALKDAKLPAWISSVVVPEGQPKTKPRALNHAFRFCSGDIIGIYDAEDAPDPDQIEKVVAKFKTSPADVACLQGILQFYNPTQNWLARCFAMDYAAWFRIILPGLSRLGLPVPLGGTTLFLKRSAMDKMHGWDAHNVTEDADLGLRLNRAGYRTELINTVTGEEANCHGWRWVRQRSRWIKGYMVTYWSHMRHPLAMIKELGLISFLAFQVLFLGTILHFVTAPLLWSFWLVFFGIDHAFHMNVPSDLVKATALAFFSIECISMIIIAIACVRADRKFLIPWIPTMSIYFLLAVPAGFKALWEFFRAPVYWDKTDHGHSLKTD